MSKQQTVARIRKEIKARVSRHRDAQREKGLAPLSIWAAPEDHDKLKRIAARMAARRGIA
jgi:hypothetical protein